MADSSLNFDDKLRRIGRPARVESIAIRFTEEELSALEGAAKERKTTLREWAREVLLRDARGSRTDALFTEIVAIRMLLNLVLKNIACGEVMTPDVFSSVLTNVRTTKHKAATDVMEQYAGGDQKEN